MIFDLLSRRNRARYQAKCAVCEQWRKNTAGLRVTSSPDAAANLLRVDICASCLKEGVRIATVGRKEERR